MLSFMTGRFKDSHKTVMWICNFFFKLNSSTVLMISDAEGESSRHVMGFLCDVYDATSGNLLVHGNFYMAEGCV